MASVFWFLFNCSLRLVANSFALCFVSNHVVPQLPHSQLNWQLHWLWQLQSVLNFMWREAGAWLNMHKYLCICAGSAWEGRGRGGSTEGTLYHSAKGVGGGMGTGAG